MRGEHVANGERHQGAVVPAPVLRVAEPHLGLAKERGGELAAGRDTGGDTVRVGAQGIHAFRVDQPVSPAYSSV